MGWGQMTPDSDLDFLLIKRACNARELARLGRNALPRGVPLDVIAATPEYLAEKGDSLSSLLRTAIEEGVRPRKYKKPPDPAREAGAAGETLPQLCTPLIEAIGRYYNGRLYPGYPEPEVAEAERALSLATSLVRHADERVPVNLDDAVRRTMMRS